MNELRQRQNVREGYGGHPNPLLLSILCDIVKHAFQLVEAKIAYSCYKTRMPDSQSLLHVMVVTHGKCFSRVSDATDNMIEVLL